MRANRPIPKREREALAMRVLEKRTFREIGEHFGISRSRANQMCDHIAARATRRHATDPDYYLAQRYLAERRDYHPRRRHETTRLPYFPCPRCGEPMRNWLDLTGNVIARCPTCGGETLLYVLYA